MSAHTGGIKYLPVQLTKQLLRKGNAVVATTRSLSRADELQQLASQSEGRLTITELDVASSTSIEVSAARTGRWGAALGTGTKTAWLLQLGCSQWVQTGVGSLVVYGSQMGRQASLHVYPACGATYDSLHCT